jgi:4-amino-4-deoxy-L-arabinose transferase-like glycosyltransferase
MVTLGFAAGFTLLVSAVMMVAGFVLSSMFLATTAVIVFVVAFASAPLFARLRFHWSTRAAVLGAALGWVLSAPLGALVNTALNAMSGFPDPFDFVPLTWVCALIPLIVVLIVAGVRAGIISRNRY